MPSGEICRRCEGGGQVTADGLPWREVLRLPLESAAAVLLGLVQPRPCPDCGGSGREAGDV